MIDSVSAQKHSRRRSRKRGSLSAASEDSVQKRSPLEQAIAEKTDRRVRYEAEKRRMGFKKTTIWVREEVLPDVQSLVKAINETEGDVRGIIREAQERVARK